MESAAAQFQFPVIAGLRDIQSGFARGQLRFIGGQLRLAFFQFVALGGGVDFRNEVALFDLLAEFHIQPFDLAGYLRAHIDGDDGVQFARGIDGGKDFPAADSFREVAHGGSVVGVFPPVPYSPDAEQKNGENDEKCFAARFHARLHEVLPVDKGKRLLKLGMAARHGK